jgi:hypothetical protein
VATASTSNQDSPGGPNRVNKLPVFFRRLNRPWRLIKRSYWLFDEDINRLKLPSICACCGRNASLSRREIGSTRDACVIVPYCESCATHASRARLLDLGAFFGSTLIAVSSSILLNLGGLNRWVNLVLSVGLSVLPLALIRRYGLPRQLGHAARGRAVFVHGRKVVVSSFAFAREMAQQNNVIPRELKSTAVRMKGWTVVGPVVALILSPTFHYLFWPQLRVLNFTDGRLVLFVDGRRIGDVEPTSGESPASGVEFRVPSGRRHLRAVSAEGTQISDIRVTLRSGSRHLFAPAALPSCLYVQRIAYGRTSLSHAFDPRVVETYPLLSEDRFWVIAPEIEPWFIPERSVQPGLTTGGLVSLLRMGRCR